MNKNIFTDFLNYSIISIIGGIFAFGLVSIYFYFSNAIAWIETPSSNDLTKYYSNLHIAIYAGFIGFAASMIFGKFIKRAFNIFTKEKQNYLLIGFLLIASIAAGSMNYYHTIQLQNKWNTNNTIGIKLNKRKIEKLPLSYSTRLKIDDAKGETNLIEHASDFNWNGEKNTITFTKHSINVNSSEGKNIISEDTSSHDDITGVTYLTYPKKSYLPYLFILAKLKESSKQSILFIYDISGDLIYKEMLKENDFLKYGSTEDEEVVLLGITLNNKETINYIYHYNNQPTWWSDNKTLDD